MFAIRGIAVSVSVFVIVYCGVSVAVVCTWGRLYRRAQRLPIPRLANLLFAARMFPLMLSVLITSAFAVPSFLLLEPRTIVEPVGNVPLVLASLAIALGIFGLGNVAVALTRTSRTIANWSKSAQLVRSSAPCPVLRIQRSVPAMTAAGIRRPRILLSGSAEFLLSGDELRTALSHEIAHIQRRDNFKKLLLHFVAFPGMQMLEGSWLQACEMAADLAAVSSTGEALDLAAALIKVSRLKPTEPSPDLTAALVHGHTAMINARIERLLSWSEEPPIPFGVSAWRWFLGVAGIVIVCAFSYSSLLAGVHTITEWLMR